MELIERAVFLNALQTEFEKVINGEGHCILLCGEAGMGKTSLANVFCGLHSNNRKVYLGSCDALFTPRPLSPLYDIAWQIRPDLWQSDAETTDRAAFFSSIFRELSKLKEPAIIVFEDIHWADEATLDFIKFLARRIAQTLCLFILTYRDNEIHPRHPLRNVLGQLPAYSFTRIQLPSLSRQAVEKMAFERGYKGEDVYSISNGNPFYVNEILASYSPGIPDNIKDAVLSVYNVQDKNTKQLWEVLSVLPTGFELEYLEMMDGSFIGAIENSLQSKILTLKDGMISFKHELYRRTIEASLSPLLRVALNKRILDKFLESFQKNQQTERIIHHAKNANWYELVERYAPPAAAQAAFLGAHTEAAKLYFSAIEYYHGGDKDKLTNFYELYAYECYLINKHNEAIIYTGKALKLWKEKGDQEKMGNCMRFLSRLWWYEGNRELAENFGIQAIEILDMQPVSKAKAMAYSNMSRLKMSMDLADECIVWGERAIEIARKVGDEETVAHALNNMGSALMLDGITMHKGIELLYESLEIALENAYHEHAARVYAILGSNGVSIKEYDLAKRALDEGIRYCDERDLDSQKSYMLSYRARLYLETGQWDEAHIIANQLLENELLLPVIKIGALTVLATIGIRKGDKNALSLLFEAQSLAFEADELQRIVPVFLAMLEYEWLTGINYIDTGALGEAINTLAALGKFKKKSRFYFWLNKAGKNNMLPEENCTTEKDIVTEARIWEQWGCPYEHALILFESEEANKRKAIAIVQQLGAHAVYEKMKLEMRSSGIKNIPRGLRKSTQSNTAHLTERELDVLKLLKEGLQNKEIAGRLYISAKTVDHHISAVLFKLDVNTRAKAVQEAVQLEIIK